MEGITSKNKSMYIVPRNKGEHQSDISKVDSQFARDGKINPEWLYYTNNTILVGKLYFKEDSIVIRNEGEGKREYALFSLYMCSVAGSKIRKHYIYIKLFSKSLIEYIKTLPKWTMIRIEGRVESFSGNTYINAVSVRTLAEIHKMTEEENVLEDPALRQELERGIENTKKSISNIKKAQNRVENIQDNTEEYASPEECELSIDHSEVIEEDIAVQKRRDLEKFPVFNRFSKDPEEIKSVGEMIKQGLDQDYENIKKKTHQSIYDTATPKTEETNAEPEENSSENSYRDMDNISDTKDDPALLYQTENPENPGVPGKESDADTEDIKTEEAIFSAETKSGSKTKLPPDIKHDKYKKEHDFEDSI